MYRLIRVFVDHTGLVGFVLHWLKLSSEHSLYLKQGIYSLLIAPGKREYSLFSFHHKNICCDEKSLRRQTMVNCVHPGPIKSIRKLQFYTYHVMTIQFYNSLKSFTMYFVILTLKVKSQKFIWGLQIKSMYGISFFLMSISNSFNCLALIKCH